MPEEQSIINAIKVKQFIKDPVIHNATFNKLPFGRYEMYSGGFTLVFPCYVNNEKWAFRCWYVDMGNISLRYKLLSQAINSCKLPYFCDFEYVDEGIVVEGKVYPTTRMKWINGKELNTFISDNKRNKECLKKLANDFLQMIQSLHKVNIAHGDLQHGNIIISDNGGIFLVDYDSMYCPALKGMPDIIVGKDDYQHPARKGRNHLASEKLDYFSELIIYISILAIAEKPELLDKYNIEDSLLFTKNDFKDVKSSSIYSDISALGGIFLNLLYILESYLSKNSIDELEPFDVILDRITKDPIIHSFESDKGNVLYKGDNFNLQWKIENATSLLVNGIVVDINKNSLSMEADSSKGYEIEVVNGLKSIKKIINVEVVPFPDISFNSSTNKIKKGKRNALDLTWTIRNAISAKLLDGNTSVEIALSGSKHVSLQDQTKYVLEAVGLDHKRLFNKVLDVKSFEEGSLSLKVDKSYVLPTVPVIVEWNTRNAKDIFLYGDFKGSGKVPACGKLVIEPDKDTEISLKIKDEFSEKEENVMVRMLPRPLIRVNATMPQVNITLNVAATMPVIQPTVDFKNVSTSIAEIAKIGIPDKNIPKLRSMITSLYTIQEPVKWWRFDSLYHYLKNKINSEKYGNK